MDSHEARKDGPPISNLKELAEMLRASPESLPDIQYDHDAVGGFVVDGEANPPDNIMDGADYDYFEPPQNQQVRAIVGITGAWMGHDKNGPRPQVRIDISGSGSADYAWLDGATEEDLIALKGVGFRSVALDLTFHEPLPEGALGESNEDADADDLEEQRYHQVTIDAVHGIGKTYDGPESLYEGQKEAILQGMVVDQRMLERDDGTPAPMIQVAYDHSDPTRTVWVQHTDAVSRVKEAVLVPQEGDTVQIVVQTTEHTTDGDEELTYMDCAWEYGGGARAYIVQYGPQRIAANETMQQEHTALLRAIASSNDPVAIARSLGTYLQDCYQSNIVCVDAHKTIQKDTRQINFDQLEAITDALEAKDWPDEYRTIGEQILGDAILSNTGFRDVQEVDKRLRAGGVLAQDAPPMYSLTAAELVSLLPHIADSPTNSEDLRFAISILPKGIREEAVAPLVDRLETLTPTDRLKEPARQLITDIHFYASPGQKQRIAALLAESITTPEDVYVLQADAYTPERVRGSGVIAMVIEDLYRASLNNEHASELPDTALQGENTPARWQRTAKQLFDALGKTGQNIDILPFTPTQREHLRHIQTHLMP
ncbi:MAG TPA: hypothetical protein VLI54_01015 [Bacillota bacterium]|nr:hypothetical protein [Bacillota bacterium]